MAKLCLAAFRFAALPAASLPIRNNGSPEGRPGINNPYKHGNLYVSRLFAIIEKYIGKLVALHVILHVLSLRFSYCISCQIPYPASAASI
jgi:hypothetical protein